MSQKSKYLLYCCLLMLGISITSILRATEQSMEVDEAIIIVHPIGEQQSGGPRAPSSTRIEAYYDADLASVCAYLVNAGETVDVEFNNLTTGDSFTFEIPGSGMSVLPIGGAAGYWTVTFTLSSGAVYEGEFVI